MRFTNQQRAPRAFSGWARLLVVFVGLLAPTHLVAQTDPPPDPPRVDATPDPGVHFAFMATAELGGALGDNVGVHALPAVAFGAHALELDLLVAGGSHLRTGAALRYRLQPGDTIAWWVSTGIAFDVLFAGDVTVWSRLTTFGTGLEVRLHDPLFLGVEVTIIPRAAPLSVTFVEGDVQEQIEHGADELPYDLALGLLRPGVYLGVRL